MAQVEPSARAPRSVEELRERILAVSDALPKRLRQCAEHVLASPERIAVSTVAELAQGAGVQPSAFMRFCQALGFSGFSEMQRLYREAYATGRPDYATRLEALRRLDGGAGHLLGDFVEAGHKSLSLLVETLDYAGLDRAVALLRDAAVIHVVGLRRSFPAASYLAYVFERMGIPVALHSGVAGLAHPHLLRAGDALIAITFTPYSAETVALARRAAQVGAPVVGVTDGLGSPIRDLPGETLTVREVDVGAFRPLSATLSLAATLAVAVGTARRAS